jgi:hypothetical protein
VERLTGGPQAVKSGPTYPACAVFLEHKEHEFKAQRN